MPSLLLVLAAACAQDEAVIVGRRVPPLSDTPVTGTVLDAAELERRRASSLQDLARTVPGFTATESGTRPFGDVFSVRGLVNTPFFSDPSAAFYVDDVPFGDAYTYVHPLDLVERVEVLRGPQHTLFGRDAYGGAVNVVSRRPDERFRASLLTDLASHGALDLAVAASAPLLPEVLSFRAGAGRAVSDGFIDNTFLGVDSDEQARYGGHLAVYWTPDPRWDLSFTAAGDRYDDGAPRLSSLSAPDPYEVASDVRGRLDLATDLQSLRVGYRGDGWEALAVTARRRWTADHFEFDLDFTPTPGNRVSFAQEQVIVSQEVRARSAAGAAPWDWVAGVYGHLETTEHDGIREFLIPNPAPPPSALQESERTVYDADDVAWAAFGQLGRRLDEVWRVHLGLRYDQARKTLDRRKTAILFPAAAPVSLEETFSKASGRAGLDARLGAGVLAYAVAALASRPGGFTAFSDDPATLEFDPEVARTFEGGVKAEFAEGRLRLDAAAYYYRISDYQVERGIPNSSDYAVFNADRVDSYGLELEGSARPFDGLRVFGAVGWTRAIFEDYDDPSTGASLDGRRVPFVPSFSAWAGAEWTFFEGLFARADYQAKGDVRYDDSNTRAFREEAYGIGSLSAGWRKDGIQASVYLDNVTDVVYSTTILSSINAGSPGPDRVIGVRLRVDF